MNIKESAQEVIDHLRGLADGSIEPKVPTEGICLELHTIMDSAMGHHYDRKASMYKGWEFWSTSVPYPIPHKNFSDPCGAFIATTNLWDREYLRWAASEDGMSQKLMEGCKADRDYGQLRLDLCEYLADYLEEMYLEELSHEH